MKTLRIILALFVACFITNISFSQDAKTNKKEIERKKLEELKKIEANLLLANKNYETYLKSLEQKENTNFSLNRHINLTPNDDKAKEITVKVNEKTSGLYLDISCKVRLGDLTIEIYDPNGEKQGEFSIESQINRLDNKKFQEGLVSIDNYEREIVEGNISKQIREPLKGNWIIKLLPTKTYASIKIQSNFRN